jgi:hypothetical protein
MHSDRRLRILAHRRFQLKRKSETLLKREAGLKEDIKRVRLFRPSLSYLPVAYCLSLSQIAESLKQEIEKGSA